MKRKLKILYVGNFSEAWMSEEYIARSFESLGHVVKRMEEQSSGDNIIEEAKNDYDFLIYARFRIDGDQKHILENVKIPKVCWFFDVYPETPREKRLFQPWVQMADHFFTTDNGHQDFYKEVGIKHECIRQGIYLGEAIEGEFDNKIETKLFFAGARNHWYRPRQKLLDYLQRTYKKDFRWPQHTIRQLPLNNAIASAKIVIGYNIFFPHYWSNRVYETLGRGGFFITPYIEGLEKDFTDRKHLVFYENDNYKDLSDKIEYYLNHNEEREAIRKAGHEHCKKNHTYVHRVNQLLSKIYEDDSSNG